MRMLFRYHRAMRFISLGVAFLGVYISNSLAEDRWYQDPRPAYVRVYCSSGGKSKCSDTKMSVLAGTTSHLTVDFSLIPSQILPDFVERGYPRIWPSELVLSASFDSSNGYSTTLMQSFNPRYVPTAVETDSFWRAHPDSFDFPPAARLNDLIFEITPPFALIGKRVFFRATFRSTYFGTLVSDRPAMSQLVIVPACAVEDSIAILASHIIAAAQNPDKMAAIRALDLMDSILAKGWKHARALELATAMASTLGQYDRALQYWDSLYTMDTTEIWGMDSAGKQGIYQRSKEALELLRSQQDSLKR